MIEPQTYFSLDCLPPIEGDVETNTSDNASCCVDYEYDMDESLGTIPLDEIIPSGIVYGITFLVGVLGNGLVIFSIVRFRRMQNVTNIFLTSLASADLLLILICVPIKFAKFFSFTWEFGEFLCKLVYYMQNLSAICSVLTLTTMSVERYYAILHPMKAKYTCTPSRARRVIILIWVLSFLLASPIVIGQIHQNVGSTNPRLADLDLYWCVKEWDSCLVSQLYEVFMLLLVLIIPLGIMSMAYASICRELWIVTSKRISMTNGTANEREQAFVTNASCTCPSGTAKPMLKRNKSTDDDRTRKQVIKMLVAVISFFALCWGPFLIDNVLVGFGRLPVLHLGHLKPARIVFALLTYLNSCINPVVYAFMSKNFRESFKYALCSCIHGRAYIRRRHYEISQTSFSQTRSTSINRGLSVAKSDMAEIDMDKSTIYTETLLEEQM